MVLSLEAATVYWDDDSGDSKWSTAVNWSPDTGINPGDTPVFDDRRVGTSIMDKAASFTNIGFVETHTEGTHVVNLIGNTLVLRGAVNSPSLSIGAATANGAVMGPSAVEFRNGKLVITNTGEAFIGYANQAASPYTAVSRGGDADGRFHRFYIGGNAGGAAGGFPTGTLDLTTGRIGPEGIDAEGIHVGTDLDFTGILKLPKGLVTTRQLYGGDSNTGANAGGRGHGVFPGTTVNVTTNYGDYGSSAASQLRIYLAGRVDYYVGTTNGLSIDNPSTHPSSGGLVIDSTNVHAGTGGLKFVFAADPPGWTVASPTNREAVFYALEWKGTNTVSFLTNYRCGADCVLGSSDDKLAWDASALSPAFSNAISIFYDATYNATYLGCYVRRSEEQRGTLFVIR